MKNSFIFLFFLFFLLPQANSEPLDFGYNILDPAPCINNEVRLGNGTCIAFNTTEIVNASNISHNTLSGIQGGSSSERFHLLSSDHDRIVSNSSSWDNLNSSQWIISGSDIYNRNSGNVGIGERVPAAKLHLNGSGNLFLTSNGTDRTVFYVSGNTEQVGIRTITPRFALDVNGVISGNDNLQVGPGANASGSFGIALGFNSNATALGTTTVGPLSESNVGFASAFGAFNHARGVQSAVVGTNLQANGDFNFIGGTLSTTFQDFTTSVGFNNFIDAVSGTAVGTTNNVTALQGLTVGLLNEIHGGTTSITIGVGNENLASFSNIIGTSDIIGTNANSSIILGNFVTITNDSSVAINMGSTPINITRSNVMAISAGDVGIRTEDPNATLHVNGDVIIGTTIFQDNIGQFNINLSGNRTLNIYNGSGFGQIRAGDFITSSVVPDVKDGKKGLDNFKDISNWIKPNGQINYSSHYAFIETDVTDYSIPIIVQKVITEMKPIQVPQPNIILNLTLPNGSIFYKEYPAPDKTIFTPITKIINVTTYPSTKRLPGLRLELRTAVLEKISYDQSQNFTAMSINVSKKGNFGSDIVAKQNIELHGMIEPQSPHMIGIDSLVGYTRMCVYDSQGYWNLIWWDGGKQQVLINNQVCNDKKTTIDNKRLGVSP